MSSIVEIEISNQLQEMGKDDYVFLNRKLKIALQNVKRAEFHWENHLEKAFFMEDIVDNLNSETNKINSSFWRARVGILGEFYDKISTFFNYLIFLL